MALVVTTHLHAHADCIPYLPVKRQWSLLNIILKARPVPLTRLSSPAPNSPPSITIPRTRAYVFMICYKSLSWLVPQYLRVPAERLNLWMQS